GALPFNESLAVSLQLAQALEEAHEKGIVHRDLKPQNVKASFEGKVKVLDFGLAKAMDPAAGSAASAADLARSPTLMQSPTLTAAHGTQLGVILGTAAYMAPEQAKGFPVDKRADIWAFGVVMFEMLAGRSLFAGDTVTDTLAGVLKTEIDFAALPASTPPAIRRLLRRCLERNPKNRLHDIADARIVLEELLSGGAAVEAAQSAAPPPPAPSIRRLAPWALLLVALGAGAGWLAKGSASQPGESTSKPTLRRLTDLPGLENHPDLSPDGKQLVYTSAASGNLDLYVMRVDGGRAINITAGSPADDEQAAFSPDGEQIAFRSSRDGGGLFVMGATGESVRRVTDVGFDPAWSPDGRRIVYSTEAVLDPYARNSVAALWIVELATGERRQLTTADAVQPAWSPDGKWIAYWANSAGQRDLWIVAAAGGEPIAVTADLATDWSPEWSPDGRWLHFSSDRAGGMNLFRIPIDPATGGAAGAPEQRTTSAVPFGWVRSSADGRRTVVAAYEATAVLDLYRLGTGPNPEVRPLRTLRPRTLHWCRLSPDAEWFACSTIGTPEDIVLLRSDGSELRRLTDDIHKDRNFSWAPDGSRLFFQSTRSGAWSHWTIRPDGSELRQIYESSQTSNEAAWSADSRKLTIGVVGRGLIDLAADRLTKQGEREATPLPAGMADFTPSAWSPSGELLGGTEVDAAQRALSVGALDPSRGVYLRNRMPMAGNGFWRFAGWLPDSRRFVALGDGQVALVDVESGDFRPLLSIRYVENMAVDLAPDGSTLVVETPSTDGDIWLLASDAGPGADP
ncbi:MAG: protein kinase, partial [Thermoanaerobaculia bacterium]|nr:protein kinase [Thermoanaerobaculia bacterium]